MSESRPPAAEVPTIVTSAPSSVLKHRVLGSARAEPAPLRRERLRQSLTLVGLSWVIALGVFTFAGGPRPMGRPLTLVVGTAGGTAAIVALCVWVLLLRGRSSLGRSKLLMLPVAIGAVPAILFWKVFWSMQFEGALNEWTTRPGFRCLALTLAIAACPLMAFVFIRSSSDPKHPALTGFAAGVGVGSAATLLTDLWCPVAFIPHLLLGHALPVMLLGGIGMLLGVFFIQLRDKK
jgi:Negative regulator of sigma F